MTTRRGFLRDVGRGMIVAAVGPAVAADMGWARGAENDGPDALSFGTLEPLVAMMQETPVDKIVAVLVEKHRAGTSVDQLISAAALANARTFGGHDYIGFHTLMALAPALHMARELPDEKKLLPVLKVLHRNTSRITDFGGRPSEILHSLESSILEPTSSLVDLAHRKDVPNAELKLAALVRESPELAYNELLHEIVHARAEVHRIVLAYRCWDMLQIVGIDQATTLLRQSLRYCINNENERYAASCGVPENLLPKLFDQFKLESVSASTREASDEWISQFADSIFKASPELAAEMSAAALADGFTPADVSQAISLAANQLVLRDEGRKGNQVQPNKPEGSVHGDSIGVHACDSANAWRNMARVADRRNALASVILSAYQVARDRGNRGGDFQNWQPYPHTKDLDGVQNRDASSLVDALRSAIGTGDQKLAAAAAHQYLGKGLDPKPVFDTLRWGAIRVDGALHAEKYYRTATEEYANTRPAFRDRQLVALARVTASAQVMTSTIFEESCRRVGTPVA